MSRGPRYMAFQRNEESKLLAQNEGPIASRLRSSFKAGDVKTSQTECTGIAVNNQTVDKPSQQSRHQKDKSNNSVAKKSELNHSAITSTIGQPSKDKHTTKSKDSKPESCKPHDSSSAITCQSLKDQKEYISIAEGRQDIKNQHAKNKASQPVLCKTEASAKSSTSQNSKNQEPTKIQSSVTNSSKTSKPSSSDVGKEKEKTRPSQKQAIKPRVERPIYYIRWKGFEETSTSFLDCALCERDMTYLTDEEEWEDPSHVENELQHSIYWHEREEVVLPEAAVLPCSHVFHSTCFSELQLSDDLIDPPCPICLSL